MLILALLATAVAADDFRIERCRHPFEVDLDIPAVGDAPMHAVFIRAPVVERVGGGVTVVSALDDGRVVAVEQGNLMGTSFHPEMTGDTRFHEYFLDRVSRVGFRTPA